ncbi:MAG: hypothetical protein M3362_00495 [Acidobacteriota bacterium]|nr:hypothetical protein [Acidobacteriota bacterium]
MVNADKRDDEITIRDLYPHLSDGELRQAEENLRRYLETAWEMYERIKADPKAYARFKALTARKRGHTIDSKESNPPSNLPQST